VLGVKAKPADAGRFASLDPCARIRPPATVSFADRPGLATGPAQQSSLSQDAKRGQFWTPIPGHFSTPIDTVEAEVSSLPLIEESKPLSDAAEFRKTLFGVPFPTEFPF
jgi:hypothetical protein